MPFAMLPGTPIRTSYIYSDGHELCSLYVYCPTELSLPWFASWFETCLPNILHIIARIPTYCDASVPRVTPGAHLCPGVSIPTVQTQSGVTEHFISRCGRPLPVCLAGCGLPLMRRGGGRPRASHTAPRPDNISSRTRRRCACPVGLRLQPFVRLRAGRERQGGAPVEAGCRQTARRLRPLRLTAPERRWCLVICYSMSAELILS